MNGGHSLVVAATQPFVLSVSKHVPQTLLPDHLTPTDLR